MALRVIEKAELSDVGRQREANEDSLMVASPLFAVADGMGGAQAGEVASRTAAAVFEAGTPAEGTPEEQLTRMVQEANRRIYKMAQEDESKRGMGTTVTVAMVDGDGVTVAHVGDSRAYRLRADELEQLTHDHSLVAELERSGQISPEDAVHHPQRSIITRALGPEPEVEVDAHTHRGRGGDVYLLCSDGLTGMISDQEMASILRGAKSLDDAAEELVRAANQSGGKDNITVVLFRVEDGPARASRDDDTLSGSETIHQGLTADDVKAAVDEQEQAGRTAPAARADTRRTRAVTTVPAPSRSRRLLGVVAGVVLVGAIVAGAVIGARSVYFVGTNDAGLVTLYRGVPYELPLGVSLYSEQYASSVPARTIGSRRRKRVLDHEWRSREDAQDLVRQLERGTLDLGEAPR